MNLFPNKNSANLSVFFLEQRPIFFVAEAPRSVGSGESPEVRPTDPVKTAQEAAERFQKTMERGANLREKLQSGSPEDKKRAKDLEKKLEELQKACGQDLQTAENDYKERCLKVMNAFEGTLDDVIAQNRSSEVKAELKNYTGPEGMKYEIVTDGLGTHIETLQVEGGIQQTCQLKFGHVQNVFFTEENGKPILVVTEFESVPMRIDFQQLILKSFPNKLVPGLPTARESALGTIRSDSFGVSVGPNRNYTLTVEQIPVRKDFDGSSTSKTEKKSSDSAPNDSRPANKERQEVKTGDTLYVHTQQGPLRLRKNPGLTAEIIARVERGKTVKVASDTVVAADGYNWVQVEVGGQTGFMAQQYLSKEKLS